MRFTLISGRNSNADQRSNADREVQFVVLDHSLPETAEAQFDQLVADITPRNSPASVAQSLQQFSRMIGLRSEQTIGNYQISANDSSVQLPVGGWQAIPIRIEDLDQPHAIEIEYDSRNPVALGFSILQPDETGRVPNFGFDAGLFVPESIVATESARAKYRFEFWPNSEKVYLVIANREQKQPANYFAVRVFKEQQTPRQSVANADWSDRISKNAEFNGRSLMAFYEQPIFIDGFAVKNFSDLELGQSINDWASFYEGTTRLAK